MISFIYYQLSDVSCAVHLCSLIHSRYEEFSHHLMDKLQGAYSGKVTDKTGPEDKVKSNY